MEKQTFTQKVYTVTKKIPTGKVATYGQIARLAGNPKASRAVGNILHKNPYSPIIACHRVVTKGGRLARHFGADGGLKTQKVRLGKEGVRVESGDKVDLTKYGWRN
jgi:methylated-DNA-protein-cysteine methyltransferase-like protein